MQPLSNSGGSPLSFPYILQQILNAAQISALYALLSVAFVLLYGVTRRINLAFGAIAMWSAYVTIMMISLLHTLYYWPWIVAAVVGVVIALVNSVALGFSLHHLVVRPLIRRTTQAMLIATIAAAIVLEEMMRLITGSRDLWLRPLFADPLHLIRNPDFPVQITAMQITAIALSLGLVMALIVMMKRHRFGVWWRASSEDLLMASLSGVSIPLVLTGTFILASLCASLSGAMIALLYGSASFVMGTIIGLKTMFVAVIGGLRSLLGALLAATLLGFFETFWSAYFDLAYRDVAAFCLLTLLLIARPEGLRRW